MKAEQAPFFNFNQMLVFSVFLHFFFMTVIMFLPKAAPQFKIIKPAFMVDLMEMPTGRVKESTVKPAKKETPAPVKEPAAPVQKEVVTKPKPVVVKPNFSSAPVPAPLQKAALPAVDKTPERNKLLEELDQVAKLDASRASQPRPASRNSDKPMLDQTFRDLEALKEKSTARMKNPKMAAPAPMTDSLDDFSKLKMDKGSTKVQPDFSSRKDKHQFKTAEDEFEAIARQKVELDSATDPKRESSYQKDLQALESLKKKKFEPVQMAKANTTRKARKLNKSSNKTINPILEKLKSLDDSVPAGEAITLSLEIGQEVSEPSEFKSQIRKLKAPDLHVDMSTARAAQRNKEQKSFVNSSKSGPPAADVLANYLGLVEKKVYDNWKEPLGGGHSKLVVSFFIFPEGNISKPVLVKRSGDPRLDNLALRAIINSEPFPPFPSVLRRPNLPLMLNFKYVQK